MFGSPSDVITRHVIPPGPFSRLVIRCINTLCHAFQTSSARSCGAITSPFANATFFARDRGPSTQDFFPLAGVDALDLVLAVAGLCFLYCLLLRGRHVSSGERRGCLHNLCM